MEKTIPLVECWKFVGSTPQKYEGLKRYVSTGALDKDHITEADVEMVTFENRPSRANLEVATGDILFAKMASTEKTFVVDEVSAKNIYSTGFCAVHADETKILSKCLYYYLSSSLFLEQKDKNSSGATQKAITNAGLAKIAIKLPVLDDQRDFTTQMDLLCDVISARKQQMAKLDELVKARFVELFGDPRNNPNSFSIVTFNDCVEYMGDIGSNGANKVVVDHLDMKDEEDYALMVRFLNFTKNDFTDDVKYISKEAYVFFKKSQIFGGELIMCKIGSAGQNYVMPYLNRPVSLGLNQIMVRINDKTLMPYLYQYLNTDYGKQLIDGCINGAVTKSITKTELKKIPVIVPPMELQQQFAAFVEQTDKSKLAIQQSLDRLETLKKSLMQKYFG